MKKRQILMASFELSCSMLLMAGLLTQLATLPLLEMILTIQFFVYPHAYAEHLVWGSILLFLLTHGPGLLSLDRLLGIEPARRYSREPRTGVPVKRAYRPLWSPHDSPYCCTVAQQTEAETGGALKTKHDSGGSLLHGISYIQAEIGTKRANVVGTSALRWPVMTRPAVL